MAPAPGLLLWLLLLGSLWCFSGQRDPSPGRRFLDLKICADEECSMLMYRAKALVDFTGPDCRFMSCKKGEHVHVYYRLAGGSPEVRAGSVGQIFVYFPKDFIKVLHRYTEKELYVPADDDSLPEEVPRQGVKSPEGAQGTELDPPPEPELGKSDSGEREGFLVTEDSPVGGADAEKLLETGAEEPVNIPPPENALSSLYSCILYISKMLIATLPDNVQPGPDFYGLPWQPVIVTAILGIVSFAIFSWRTILVLQQEIEEGGKLHAELTEQIKSLERSQKDLEVALTHKDDNIKPLTSCITQLNLLECELESEDQNEGGNESDELANGEVGGDQNEKIKNRIKRMMDVSWVSSCLKSQKHPGV